METVLMHISGKEHCNFTSYRIDSNITTPTDSWDVSLGIPAGEMPRIPPFAPMSIKIGNELVLTGHIDSMSRQSQKDNRYLSLHGRDLAGVLCDSSAPIFATREIGLEGVIEEIIRPMGITKIHLEVQGEHEKVTIDPGMTAWSALERVCELNGCFPWMNPDGTLVISRPDYTQKPAGELVLDRNGRSTNVISLSVARSIVGWHSEVTVLAQTHGNENRDGTHSINACVKDSLLTRMHVHRPKIIVDGDSDSQESAEKLANKILADGRLNGLTITATVRGHRIKGKNTSAPLWTPGQIIRVTSHADELDGNFFLTSRTFQGGMNGQTTSLTLKHTDCWLPEIAKKETRHQKRILESQKDDLCKP